MNAKITEDNGGGVTLWVMDEHDIDMCIFAHSGYEYVPGQLSQDITVLIADDSIVGWDGNEPELAEEWGGLEIDDPNNHLRLIADVADGKLTLYPEAMGAAGRKEFGVAECAYCCAVAVFGAGSGLFGSLVLSLF